MFFDARRISILLATAALAVVGAGAASLYLRSYLGYEYGMGLVPTFNLDAKNNVPTYFSSLLLLSSGLLLLLVSRSYSAYRAHWGVLGIIFCCLSVDEVASLHEIVGYHVQATWETSGLLFFGWVIPASAFVAFLGVAYTRFLLHLPRRFLLLFLLSAACYLGGAIGFESVSGAQTELHGKEGNRLYDWLAFIEETLEVAGATLFLSAMLHFVERFCLPMDIRPAREVVKSGWSPAGRLDSAP